MTENFDFKSMKSWELDRLYTECQLLADILEPVKDDPEVSDLYKSARLAVGQVKAEFARRRSGLLV
jgi:hypothetical protein